LPDTAQGSPTKIDPEFEKEVAGAATRAGDTARWLVVAITSGAALLLGTSPLANIGDLELWGDTFWVAVASAALAILALMVLLGTLLAMLRPKSYTLQALIDLERDNPRSHVLQFIDDNAEIYAPYYQFRPKSMRALKDDMLALLGADRRARADVRNVSAASGSQRIEAERKASLASQRLSEQLAVVDTVLLYAKLAKESNLLSSGRLAVIFVSGALLAASILSFSWSINREDDASVGDGPSYVNAVLQSADFAGVDMRGSSFAGATISQTSFAGADLRDVSFDGASLSGVTLEDARVTPDEMASVSAWQRVTCPDGSSSEENAEAGGEPTCAGHLRLP
jgi:hypothetical protein